MANLRKHSQVIFAPDLPKAGRLAAIADPKNSLLIFDRKLLTAVPGFRKWAQLFPHRYAVTSGEGLKSLDAFASHAKKLAKQAEALSPRTMTIVAVGGGSVGDFAGFFASVYKRGVRLVHLPSTWLSAIDSSHGGKTALNSGGAKNQIGTFYPAEKVLLVRSLLKHQPQARVLDAMGELAKIALIDGGSWVRKLQRSKLEGKNLLWQFLRPAIQAKLKIVDQDPEEKTGHRQILNLGHTFGHVLEAAHGWSHGRSVAQGLFFALAFSLNQGKITVSDTAQPWFLLNSLGLKEEYRKIPLGKFTKLLLQDKKKSGRDQVTFIFLRRLGKVERSPVAVKEIVEEARRQGWV